MFRFSETARGRIQHRSAKAVRRLTISHEVLKGSVQTFTNSRRRNKSMSDEVPNVFDHCKLTDCDPNDLLKIDSKDLALIKEIWQQEYAVIEKDIGLIIFEEIFNRSECARLILTGRSRLEPDFKITDYPRILKHTKVVKNALDKLITSLADLCSPESQLRLVNNVRKLGAQHTGFRAQKFKPELWYVFAETIVDLANGWSIPFWKRARFYKAWRTLITFVIVNMRFGYDEMMCRQSHSSCDSGYLTVGSSDINEEE